MLGTMGIQDAARLSLTGKKEPILLQ